MEIRKGFIKLTRLGPIKFHNQKGVPHAPERWGIWAFPDPIFHWDFAVQQYIKHMPKEAFKDDQLFDKWMNITKHRVAKRSTFWYSGDVYCHLMEDGSIYEGPNGYSMFDTKWSLMDVTTYARRLSKLRVDQYGLNHTKSNTEYTEVFIPRGRGFLRHSTP